MTRTQAQEFIGSEIRDKVLTLTLGAGPAHPLSQGMIAALHCAVLQAGGNTDVNAIVIHGPGKIFCAGHDLKEIARHRSAADNGHAYLKTLFFDCSALMTAITMSPKPAIAMVEGIATAGGLQLAASCDLIFAAPQATFCLPGVNNGGFCTTPSVAVGRSISRKHLTEMALSGEIFDANWAMEAGLINRIVSADDLARFVHDFAARLASRNPNAVAQGKQMLHRQLEMPLEQAYAAATDVMIGHFMDPARIARDLEEWG